MLECLDFGHSPGYSSCAASSHGRSAAAQTWPCPPFRPAGHVHEYHGLVYVSNSSTCLIRWRNKNISIVIVKRQSSSYSLKSMYQTNLTDVHKMYQKASLLIIHNLRLIDAVKWHILMEKTQVKMCQAFSWNVFCTRNQVRNPACHALL